MGLRGRAWVVAAVIAGAVLAPAAAASAREAPPVGVKATTPEWQRFGDPISVHVRLTNPRAEALDADLAISLGHGLAFVALEPESGSCTPGRPVVCDLAPLAPGETRALTLRVRARAPVLYTHVTPVVGTPADAEEAAASAFFSVCSHLGTNGDDLLVGTMRRDVICGRGGDDRIVGRDGGDHVDAGAGDDRIALGRGRNVVFAGAGADLVRGGPGRDAVDAGRGRDRVFGRSGNDALLGEGGADSLFGGAGDDELTGSSGRDRLEGGAGDDMLDALDEECDFVDGGVGRDVASTDPVDRLISARRAEFLLGWDGFD